MNKRFSVFVRILVLSVVIAATYLLFGRLKAQARIPAALAVAIFGMCFIIPIGKHGPIGKPGSGIRLIWVLLSIMMGVVGIWLVKSFGLQLPPVR